MATRAKKVYSTYTGRQRVSLVNGDTPGRKTKPYHVSFYEFVEQPSGWTYVNAENGWVPSSGIVTHAGVDVNRFPESADFMFDPFGLPNAESVSSRAVSKLHAQVQKARDTGFNAAVFIAELPSTMQMFANTATRLFYSTRALRRGDLKSAYRSLGIDFKGRQPPRDKVRDRSANYWLEMQYGWLPLLSDVDAAAHKVADIVTANPKLSVRARASQSQTTTGFAPSGAKHMRASVLMAEYGLTFTVSSPAIAHAASLGFTNPMLIAWETVPLSFVFDWLIPVGDWLAQFSTFHGLSFQDGWGSRKGSLEDVYSYPGVDQSGTRPFNYPDENGNVQTVMVPSWHYSQQPGSITVKQSGFHRIAMADFPGREAPRLDFGPSLKKLVTSLALIRQRT